MLTPEQPKTATTAMVDLAMRHAKPKPVIKEIESRLSVMETNMLRWTAGVTRLDRVRNDTIRQKFGVAPIAEKLREARLRCYCHVLRTNNDTVCEICLDL
ncbi:unnamed protein product [Heligmosomoides polygyrus]|uniref:Fe-S protein n=1 Tax=Heligmosomoides polygyrus TaxID=6339 RepID=A0A183G164_HELPZ|nr:unnamed protein product [Heligmosomoides polygyrus]